MAAARHRVATYVVLRLLAFFAVITLPLVVALLITSLSVPVVRLLSDVGLPRAASAGLVVVTGLAVVGSLLTFVGQQVANGANDLATSVADGLDQIKDWLKTGPLHATDTQINTYIEQAQQSITETAQQGEVVGRLTEVGTDDRPRPRRVLHRAVLDVLLPRRRRPDLGAGWSGSRRAPPASGSTAPVGSPGTRSPSSSGPPCWWRSPTRSGS